MSYPMLLSTVEEAIATLTEIGFTADMLASSRLTLSGGWKMKLLIVRAILSKADILLLDEPTNHLDTASVQWLVQYLRSQAHVTCLIVSHDPQFLDQVITDVIHYEQRQLVYYPGSLKDFVALHPEAQYYYELETSTMKFAFPNPERLDGVNSLTRAIMKMDNATFTYPGCSKPSLTDCSVKLTLGSRVGVTGVNGAGKSTLIKLLVQEITPDKNGECLPSAVHHSSSLTVLPFLPSSLSFCC
jgi:elongation factor 3